MNISIASYAFHGLFAAGVMDLFTYLESVKFRYRLDAADIWNGMLVSLEPDYLAKVKEGLHERELALVNLCVDGAHVWDPDPATREQLYRNALANLQAAAYLGARTMRLDVGVREDTISEEALDYIVMRYREYADFAVDHGFRVGPETHWGASLYVEQQLKLHAAVDHPGYGLLLHVGRWKAGDPARNDAAVAPFTMHTHFDGALIATALEERLRLLLDAGYTGYFGIEHQEGQREYAEVAYEITAIARTLRAIEG